MSDAVVIVGAGAGGDAAAMGLRKQGYEGRIVLIGVEPDQPYERPYLSKQYLRHEIPDEKVFLRPQGEYERSNIELLSTTRVVSGDRSRRTITLESGDQISFEHLILATGAKPRELPGAPRASNTFMLRSLADALSLRKAIDEADRLLIIGAGFIGAEVAASARKMDKQVTMVEAQAVPLERVLGSELGRYYARVHRNRGVDLRTGTTVDAWHTEGDRITAATLSDGSRCDVDVVVMAIGVSPNLEVAHGLSLGMAAGGVETDETLQAAPGIFAIGDISAHLHPVYARHIRVEHWQVAQHQGTAVAASIAGAPTPYTELPWFWSDQYDLNLQFVGESSEADATVLRGNVDDEKFSAFFMKNGVVQAVMSVNDGRTGRLSRLLISRHIPVSASTLADTGLDLRTLAAG